MEELLPIVSAVQGRLREEMSRTGVSYEDATGPLGYANKSSIARLLIKDRMSLEDVLKLMVLCKTPSINISRLHFKVEIKAASMAQVEALLDALRVSVFKEGTVERFRLPDGLTWDNVAEITGFDFGKSARKSWFLLQTPLYLVVGLLWLLYAGAGEHTVTASGGKASLRFVLG